jgi:metallo-beta-lactamase class B
MRIAIALAAAVWVGVAACQEPPPAIPSSWTAPVTPFHIIDTIYYVGTEDLASYLITTPAGHILIDTGVAQNADTVLAAIRALKFDPADVELLLTTQAHFDHVGAHARLKQVTGAQVVVSSEDRPVLEGGGKGDYHFGPRYYFPPVTVDRVVHDRAVVSLGRTSLTARVTPGHTRGTTTWTTSARDRTGRLRPVVFLGSTAVNEGVRLVDNREYPLIASDFAKSFRVLHTLPCEIFLAAHVSTFDGLRKAELARSGQGEDAFVDPEGCRAAVTRSERAFTAELQRQQSGG